MEGEIVGTKNGANGGGDGLGEGVGEGGARGVEEGAVAFVVGVGVGVGDEVDEEVGGKAVLEAGKVVVDAHRDLGCEGDCDVVGDGAGGLGDLREGEWERGQRS